MSGKRSKYESDSSDSEEEIEVTKKQKQQKGPIEDESLASIIKQESGSVEGWTGIVTIILALLATMPKQAKSAGMQLSALFKKNPDTHLIAFIPTTDAFKALFESLGVPEFTVEKLTEAFKAKPELRDSVVAILLQHIAKTDLSWNCDKLQKLMMQKNMPQTAINTLAKNPLFITSDMNIGCKDGQQKVAIDTHSCVYSAKGYAVLIDQVITEPKKQTCLYAK